MAETLADFPTKYLDQGRWVILLKIIGLVQRKVRGPVEMDMDWVEMDGRTHIFFQHADVIPGRNGVPPTHL